MGNAMTEPPLRQDGLALYPFIIWPGGLPEEERPLLDITKVRQSVYSMWSSPHGSVFSKNHGAWHKLAFPEGAGEPRSDAVSAAFTWPALQETGRPLTQNDFDSDTDRKSTIILVSLFQLLFDTDRKPTNMLLITWQLLYLITSNNGIDIMLGSCYYMATVVFNKVRQWH